MTDNLYQGELVELVPIDIEKDTILWEKWDHDSDYLRLLDDCPAVQYSSEMIKEWIEKAETGETLFMISTVADHKTIGFVGLNEFDWLSRSAWVGIAIGNPDYQGKGYGTEAMKLILKYAFLCLNLHRVNLDVFDFNQRAIRSYEKCGFTQEGVQREILYKEDRRWGMLNMGILESEWKALNNCN